MALAEVVVCAVGRVVTLPAVEITAQATALLVLVMLSAAEDNGWESLLFSGRRDSPRDPAPGRTETVTSALLRTGRRVDALHWKLWEELSLWIRSFEGRSKIVVDSDT
ncbi:hypothetical protein H920_13993 [Fukomys damarensis]|uniref:Uncharacterized protein n=1 Tax=Fukomys damarensis TaxID=885580 RepID=A0A091D0I9_FUKDA|nr:hypothetical protein H920_13993 [Fukomys damarensis]